MNESPAEKSAEKREMQLAAMRHDMSMATPMKEVVWQQVQRGVNLEYLAMRYGPYGFTLEKLKAARATHEAREALKAERIAGASGGPG